MRNGRGSCVKWLRVGGGKSEWRRRNFASVPGPWLACGFKMKHPFNHIICCTSIKIQGPQKSLASFAHFHKGLSTHAREVAISPLVKPSRLATSVAVGKDNKLQLYLASLLLRKSRKSLFSNSNSAQNVSNSSSCLGLICHRPHQSHQVTTATVRTSFDSAPWRTRQDNNKKWKVLVGFESVYCNFLEE